MDKFQSDRIEFLKIQFYSIIGQLELLKNVVISNKTLQIFENSLLACKSEPEVAASILGTIRRYKLMLDEKAEQLSGPHILPVDVGVTGISIEGQTLNIREEVSCSQIFTENLPTDEQLALKHDILPADVGETEIFHSETVQGHNGEVLTVEPDVLLTNVDEPEIFHSETIHKHTEGVDAEEEGLSLVEAEPTDACFLMVKTNTLVQNLPYVNECELNTTRDKKSFFLIYSRQFTFKRHGKYPRFECKTCRSLCDKDARTKIVVTAENRPAAITFSGNVINEIKKSTHHSECRVEFSGAAMARSQKNAAVVFKSKFGGTSKHVYDTHSKILSAFSNLTAADFAHGFQNFEYASSALKKSSKRKSSINTKKVDADKHGVIDKLSTPILKSTHEETDDYFLIGQDVDSGVIVLGSKFLIERFFKSRKTMSDGTFDMAPKGYKQSYMLWHIIEGKCKGEDVPRSKAILSVIFVLKGKSQKLYDIAFKILDDYRKAENIPEPSFEEYLTDDEPAVRNAVGGLYVNTKFSLCLFHLNQNIVKCLTEHRLSNFIRKCKKDEQLWFYGKIKQVLVIPLLKENSIIPAFDSLSASIVSFIESNFTNAFEIDQFKKYFATIKERYFSNPDKIKLICKYNKFTRCTNLVESTHSAFNKSTLIPKHGTVTNFVEGMTTVDLEYRATVISFEEKGARALPKKKNRYTKQQSVITEYTKNLDNNTISVNEFLERCAEAMIHSQYYKLVEEATKRFESQMASNAIEEVSEIDEHIMAIFATSESNSGRVRKLCSKYFGDDWLN